MANNLHPSIKSHCDFKKNIKKNIIDSLDTLQFVHVQSNAHHARKQYKVLIVYRVKWSVHLYTVCEKERDFYPPLWFINWSTGSSLMYAKKIHQPIKTEEQWVPLYAPHWKCVINQTLSRAKLKMDTPNIFVMLAINTFCS